MSVEVERAGVDAGVGGATVDRSRSARVVALRPHVGRHAATGTSPEVAALVDTVPTGHPPRHLPGTRAGQDPDGRPLVRELEDVVAGMHRRGPTRALTAELTELLSAWAAALVRLHRTPLSAFAPEAPRPWVLDEPLPDWLDELPAQAGPVWAVRAHPAIGRAVHEAGASWTAAQWTHGEPTGDEVAITRVHGTARAVLLGRAPGSEGRSPAGCGDPRWDVSTVLDWLAIALGPVLDPAWDVDPVAIFVAEYRDLGGDATPTRAMAVARTLGTAIEWSAQLVLAGEASDDELAWLSGLWTRPLELVGAARPGAARRR